MVRDKCEKEKEQDFLDIIKDGEILVNLFVILNFYQQINMTVKKKEFFQEMMEQPIFLTLSNFLNICSIFELRMNKDSIKNKIKLTQIFKLMSKFDSLDPKNFIILIKHICENIDKAQKRQRRRELRELRKSMKLLKENNPPHVEPS